MDNDSKHDVSSETPQFQPLNSMFNTIVLPPTNFESVYDQRDNDEVLSDIRQVKSELENSVLQGSIANAAENFDRNPQNGVVMILSGAENSDVGKVSQGLEPTQILVRPSVVVDEVEPVVANTVDCVVRSEKLDASEIVTINVRDRNPGEPDTEILAHEDPEDCLDEFCRKHLSPEKRLASLTSRSEPLKDVVPTPKLDAQIEEAIRHNSKSASEVQKQVANSVLTADGSLRDLQLGFRKLSAPVLELVSDMQEGKPADWEGKVGDILCQLVLLNEQVVSMRRNRILEHLKQNSSLAEELGMPEGEGDLFGSRFIDENALFKSKKIKRNNASEVPPRILKQKRIRKETNFCEKKDAEVIAQEVEIVPVGDPDFENPQQGLYATYLSSMIVLARMHTVLILHWP